MQAGARLQTAIEILEQILSSSTPADQVMTQNFRNRRYIGAGDRRYIAEIIYQTLRQRQTLTWALEKASAEPSARLFMLALLVVLEHQKLETLLSHFNGQPYHPRVLTEFEKMVVEKLRGLNFSTQPLYARLNIPEWIVPFFEETFKEQMEVEALAMNQPAALDLRINTLKTNRVAVIKQLNKADIACKATPFSPVGIRLGNRRPLGQDSLWQNGFIEVQDEGSQLISLLCDARPGMTVVDYCAGAGGKSLAIASAMENKGRIIACDIVDWRLERSKQRFRRAGVHNVECRLLDDTANKWLKRQQEKVDRLLLDVPCSGTGTWRRNPDLKWRLTSQDLEEVMAIQQNILKRTAALVKKGGRLIYGTCSVLKEENEVQISWFLENFPDFRVVPVGEVWSCIQEPQVPCPVEGDFLRLSPYQHQTDGFFAAILERL